MDERVLRSLAYRYANWLVPAEDLMQEGRIAAWQAEGTYNSGRGMGWQSYAVLAARRAMINYLVSPVSNRAGQAPLSWEGMVIAGRDFAPMLIECMSAPKEAENKYLATLRMLTEGEMPPDKVALSLGITKRAVWGRIEVLYREWGVSTLVSAYNEAMRRGLIDPPDRGEHGKQV